MNSLRVRTAAPSIPLIHVAADTGALHEVSDDRRLGQPKTKAAVRDVGLAKDTNPRVRRVLAKAAARAYARNPEALDELIVAFASDVRYSVRAAASSAHKA